MNARRPKMRTTPLAVLAVAGSLWLTSCGTREATDVIEVPTDGDADVHDTDVAVTDAADTEASADPEVDTVPDTGDDAWTGTDPTGTPCENPGGYDAEHFYGDPNYFTGIACIGNVGCTEWVGREWCADPVCHLCLDEVCVLAFPDDRCF